MKILTWLRSQISIRSLLVHGVPSILLVLLCVYAIWFRGDASTFWDGAVANALGSVAAVFGGMQVAMWLWKYQSGEQEQAAKRERLKKRSDLLRLLADELADNRIRLKARLALKDEIVLHSLKLGFWESVKASGDLTYVDDPLLLGAIADAYHWLSVVAEYERLAVKSRFSPTATDNATGKTVVQMLFDHLRIFYVQGLTPIDTVLCHPDPAFDGYREQLGIKGLWVEVSKNQA